MAVTVPLQGVLIRPGRHQELRIDTYNCQAGFHCTRSASPCNPRRSGHLEVRPFRSQHRSREAVPISLTFDADGQPPHVPGTRTSPVARHRIAREAPGRSHGQATKLDTFFVRSPHRLPAATSSAPLRHQYPTRVVRTRSGSHRPLPRRNPVLRCASPADQGLPSLRISISTGSGSILSFQDRVAQSHSLCARGSFSRSNDPSAST